MKAKFLQEFAKANACEEDESIELKDLPSGWDSLSYLVTVGIYEELGVRVDEQKMKECQTVGDLVKLLEA